MIRILVANANVHNIPFASNTVHCVVTSPPYWQLRDYCVEDQIGREATPDEYIDNIVAIMREVKRVLRDDGTLWLNLGTTFAKQNIDSLYYRMRNDLEEVEIACVLPLFVTYKTTRLTHPQIPDWCKKYFVPERVYKKKDDATIPHAVYQALMADGWYGRLDNVWSKIGGVMPESVTDRPSKTHEYVFLLAKSDTYFYDEVAVKVKAKDGSGLANLKSVWNLTRTPYKGDHFAVFPETLPDKCIKAGTSEHGVCAECGAPYIRVTETYRDTRDFGRNQNALQTSSGSNRTIGNSTATYFSPTIKTIGWEKSCNCATSKITPAIVYDPFVGSGTTVAVARRLGRIGIGTDISYDYITRLLVERVGMNKEKDWIDGNSKKVDNDVYDLPLFRNEL